MPLVPVIVSEYGPTSAELQDTVAVPEVDKVPGAMAVHERPDGTLAVKPIVPVNPLIGVTVIDTTSGVPAFTDGDAEAEIEKSVTTNLIVVE